VIASCRSHPNNAAVQKNACAVFLNLARQDGSPSELGEVGIDVMVAAMRNHPLESDIQAFASGGESENFRLTLSHVCLLESIACE
jgi:hypothetical protein